MISVEASNKNINIKEIKRVLTPSTELAYEYVPTDDQQILQIDAVLNEL
jgi:hypothetical protein